MAGLDHVIARLSAERIPGELWVDGGFLTQSINPNDVDIVLRIAADIYDNGTLSQQAAIDWLNSDLKTQFHCDSYYFMEWPQGHRLYWYGEMDYAYWMRQWGMDRAENLKGIAVVRLPI
ncbi:MAG: hypothetical protein JW395_0693 [Nitrospira sp.]|nr:hypothetical protein [Nitrospira sp.]